MSKAMLRGLRRGRKGSAIIFVAVAIVMLLSFAALAVDVGYLYMVRAEIQNAADSGALAGAQVLYNNSGTAVNPDADDMALEYVQKNYSEHAIVEVIPDQPDGVTKGVQIGHWSFATRTFTPYLSLPYPDPPILWNVTTEELDADTNFINAVRVITQRKRESGVPTDEPPLGFFSRVFGALRTDVRTSAVAYIGFAGTLEPDAVDKPIAICKESILINSDEYTCGVGRMINSGPNLTTTDTGGWTDYNQPAICTGASSANDVRPYTSDCSSGGNPRLITLGRDMNTIGGQAQTLATDLLACWAHITGNASNYNYVTPPPPTQPWPMRLPVVTCPGNNLTGCSLVVGMVQIDVLWITNQTDPSMANVPRLMAAWHGQYPPSVGYPLGQESPISSPGGCTGSGVECWDSFRKYFNLRYVTDAGVEQYVEYTSKTLYFLPNCSPHVPAGRTGGENFGILAKIPVLVK